MSRKNLSATSRKAAVNARKSPANKTPKGSGKKKSAKKKKSSSKSSSEEEEEEDEADEEEGKKTSEIQYKNEEMMQRPGKEGSPKGIKNRLTKESFRKHYRASAGGRKKKVYWTMMEVDALERGFKKYGRKWSRILEVFRVEFNTCRTSVDLKDKYDGMQRSKNKNVDDDAASPKKKRQKLSHSIQADEESDEDDEEDEAMEEEEEDEEDIFKGDVRVRVRFGRKGKVYKLAAVGNHTFEELIEGCREVNGVTTHQENIYVQASMMKDDEADVDAEACVGTVVPSDFDASSGKPKVWMVVRSKQGDSPKKKSTSSKKKVAAQLNGESL